MTRYFNCKLNDDTRQSPEDPLGSILIIGDKGKIEEDNIFIDTFIEALIKCLDGITTNNRIIADTTDEPYNLIINKETNGLRLEFGSQFVFIENTEIFVTEARSAVHKLINILDDYCQSLNKDPLLLSFLRNYSKLNPVGPDPDTN